MQSACLSVEQGLHLVQMLAQYRTENTKLRLRVREKEIQISHMESLMPEVTEKAIEMSRPEATPEEIGRIHNGISVFLDQNDVTTANSILEATQKPYRRADGWKQQETKNKNYDGNDLLE